MDRKSLKRRPPFLVCGAEKGQSDWGQHLGLFLLFSSLLSYDNTPTSNPLMVLVVAQWNKWQWEGTLKLLFDRRNCVPRVHSEHTQLYFLWPFLLPPLGLGHRHRYWKFMEQLGNSSPRFLVIKLGREILEQKAVLAELQRGSRSEGWFHEVGYELLSTPPTWAWHSTGLENWAQVAN